MAENKNAGTLALKHVSAGYRGEIILKDATLTIVPGRVTVLLGPNGSGKSTLLHTIMGLHKPVSGEILLDGRSTADMKRGELARHIGFLSQNRTVPQMTAERLVLHGRFPYIRYPRTYSTHDREIAKQAIEAAGVTPFAHMPLTQLSGGQRQSVYLAMVLAQQTEIVLMDEPTTYLDMAHQFRLFDTARRLADEGKAVLMVLHDLTQALRVADRVILLDEGTTTEAMTAEEAFASGRLEHIFGIRLVRAETEEGPQYVILPKKDS